MSVGEHGPAWPLDEGEHMAQVEGLREVLGDVHGERSVVLDLGAGDGRVALPLAEMGHRVVAVDVSGDALALIEHDSITRHRVDMLDESASLLPEGIDRVDAAVCLGHTFMLVHEIERAQRLLERVRGVLSDAGVVVLDDLPALVIELTEGNWQSGFAEDGRQMVWADRDLVFAIRDADDGDPGSWVPGEGDVRCRLWTQSELELVARASGFGGCETMSENNLLVLRA